MPSKYAFLLASIFLLSPFFTKAQADGTNGLTVKGIITRKGTPLQDARIRVYDQGNRLIEDQRSKADGSFRVRLPLDGRYVVEFTKEGLITKRLLFRTRTPEHDVVYHPFDLEIALYNEEKAEKASDHDPDMPLGIVQYFPQKGDFDYVEDYTRERLKEQRELLKEEG